MPFASYLPYTVSNSCKVEKLNQLIRGWINYFKIGSMKTLCKELDSNIRYRLRMCIWKHWKTPQNRAENLIKLGMNKEDAKLCFERHATSKLYTDDDLFNISSLGFRGEALPSIASVSNVILKTCSDEEIGFMVHIKGGTLIEEGECEARKGTSITVNNLSLIHI